jgi:nitrogen fixation/metabolism regulation signal transduction histidine kinase
MRFVFGFLAVLVLFAALIAALFAYVSVNTVTTGYADSILKVEKTSKFFFVSFTLMTAIVLAGMSAIGMVIFILLSHRVAGPLYRIERIIKEVESGNLKGRIKLRKTDLLSELKDVINDLVISLDSRLSKLKGGIIEARRLTQKRDDPEAAVKLEKILGSLRSDIDHFKVTFDHKEQV